MCYPSQRPSDSLATGLMTFVLLETVRSEGEWNKEEFFSGEDNEQVKCLVFREL